MRHTTSTLSLLVLACGAGDTTPPASVEARTQGQGSASAVPAAENAAAATAEPKPVSTETSLKANNDAIEETTPNSPNAQNDSATSVSTPSAAPELIDDSLLLTEPEAAAELGSQSGQLSAPSTSEDACVSAVGTASIKGGVILFVVDTSDSMHRSPDATETGPSKWETTHAALRTTVGNMSAETALGLTFYPNVNAGGRECYLPSLAAPIAPLDEAHRKNITTALDTTEPLGATPTHDAYRYGLGLLEQSPLQGERFLVLITDGAPTYALECEGNGVQQAPSEPIIEEAASATLAGVRTFVIGSPGSDAAKEALSAVARAGNTAPDGCSDTGPDFCHFDMTTKEDFAGALNTALEDITELTFSCSYAVPIDPDGQTLDRDRVNVRFIHPDGTVEAIGKDPSERDCEAGWQYAEDGSHIDLCPDTCELARATTGIELEILFGCSTVLAPDLVIR